MNQTDITDYFTSSYIPCRSLNVAVSNFSFSISVVMIIFAPPNPISSGFAEKSMTVIS